MGSIYKRKGEKCWTIAWIDHNGRQRTKRIRGTNGRADRDVAVQMLAKEEGRIARGEAGLLDPFEETKRTPLAKLVADYVCTLTDAKLAQRYVAGVRDRLGLAFEVMGAQFLTDATLPKAEAFLAKLTTGAGLPPMKPRTKGGNPLPRPACSTPTRNRYAETLRTFGRWLADRDGWPNNPFAKLRNIESKEGPRRSNRAFTPGEIGKLVEAATTRAVQQWAATHQGSKPAALAAKLEELRAEGWRRSVLYEFAAYTGLRRNECRTLTWADVVLDGVEPSVTAQAANAKNRKAEQAVPLVPWVVEALRELRRRNNADRLRVGLPLLAQSDRVFRINRGLLEALRKDARWAELGDFDAQGRRTTFHGFRASTCTMLHRAGVAIAVAVLIMRHADPKLTMRTYAKLDALADGHRELGKMATPKVTAVPLTVPVTVHQRPALAVGDSGCPTAFGEGPSQVAALLASRPTLAEVGRTRPVAEVVGVAGVEPATLSLSS